MKQIILLVLFTLGAYNLFPQHIYLPKFEISRSFLQHLVKEKQKADWEDNRYNSTDSLPRSKGKPIRMQRVFTHLGKANFAPFILAKNDTVYANASYFEWLKIVDVTHPFPPTLFGKLKKPLKYNTLSAEELFYLMFAAGIINTSPFLARFTVDRITDENNYIKITYNVLGRLCTSECFDIPFIFKLQYHKQTLELSVIP